MRALAGRADSASLPPLLVHGAAVLLTGLAGCTMPQPFEAGRGGHRLAAPPALPAQLQSVAHAEPLSDGEEPKPEREESLPAPRLLPSEGMSIDQAINNCLLADPRIRAGLEKINQAQGDALTASLKPNPTLFTDIQLLPLTRPFTVEEQGGPPQQDVNVAYSIDWYLFGKRAAAMTSTGLGVRGAEADYANLVRQRVTDTALAFYNVLEAKALLDLARQDVANLQRIEGVTAKAVDRGGRPQVELNRIRLNLVTSQRAQHDAVAALVVAKARLRAFFGRADADPAFDVTGALDAPLTAEPLPVEDAYGLALQNRPDLEALRWKAAQATADIEVERRRAFPEVAPQLGYTRQYQTKAIGFPDANSWSAAVTMTLPVHDRNQGNRAKAVAAAAQSQFELQAGLVELRAEIESVVQEFRTARIIADAVAREQLQLAEQVRESINRAYAERGRSLLDVLDAQRNYRETYRTYISGRANYWRALYRFNSAIGKQVTR